MQQRKWYDMREFLAFLESKKDIVYIDDPVDPEWEINGLTRIGLQEHAPAIVFRNIKGASDPLVTNLIGTDRRFLWALGIEKWSDFNEEWCRRTQNLVPWRVVDTAPCQEVVLQGDEIDLTRICNVKWHQHDGGAFAGAFPGTLSVSVTKDRDTGVLDAGIYRMGTLSKNTLGWGAPEYTHGRQHYMMYERHGEVMPMTVITGYDPTVQICADTRTPPGIDEFQVAGGLRGEALDMVKCLTNDIHVPATCEFVFEGIRAPEPSRNRGRLRRVHRLLRRGALEPGVRGTARYAAAQRAVPWDTRAVVPLRERARGRQVLAGGRLRHRAQARAGRAGHALRRELRVHRQDRQDVQGPPAAGDGRGLGRDLRALQARDRRR